MPSSFDTSKSLKTNSMEAEQLNIIANRLNDLNVRNQDLRGYL